MVNAVTGSPARVVSSGFRAALSALLCAVVLAACGGGGGDGGTGGGPQSPTPGAQDTTSFTHRSVGNGFTYAIDVYVPASHASGTATYPVIYATEGDAPYGGGASRFVVFKEAMKRRNTQAILVGISGTAWRNTDFLMPGAVLYTNFVAKELAPLIESRWRADPGRRALSGLSHGGYLVVAALVLEATSGTPSFSHYLATEPSFGGHGSLPGFLEFERQLDAAGPRPIPATLFITGARGFNLPIADAVYAQMAAHGHPGLTVIRAEYGTSHVGADLPAFEEALERFFTP